MNSDKNQTLLTDSEEQALKDSLLKFVLRVSTYGENRWSDEIQILPAIAELLLRR